MKKIRKGLCLFLAVALLVSFIPCISVSAADVNFASSGDGTEASPYIIETYAQIYSFSSWVNSGKNTEYVYVKLGNDIVIDSEDDMSPIGERYNFYGCFDGDGHIITNSPNMCLVSSNAFGLFCRIENSTIKNLGMNGDQVGACYNEYNDDVVAPTAGAIAAYAYNSRIENCYNLANVAGSNSGGIVGVAENTVITDCYNEGLIEADYRAGGIVACAKNTQIIKCYNIGEIKASSCDEVYLAGGIVASATNNTEIINCYNTGDLSPAYEQFEIVGGIAGYFENSLIDGCYNTGEISAQRYVGGVVGYTSDFTQKSVIRNSHSFAYPLVGEGSATIENSFVHDKLTVVPDDDAVEITYTPEVSEGDEFIAVFENGERVKIAKVSQNRTRISGLKYGVEYTFTPIFKVDGEYKLYDYASVKYTLEKVVGPKPSIISRSENSISFSWKDIEGAQLYYVTVMCDGYRKCIKTTDTQLTVKGLDSGKIYSVTIKAKLNSGKYSEQGETTNIPTYSASSVMGPTPLFKEATKDSLRFYWFEVKGAETYYVTVEGEGYKKCFTTTQTELTVKSLKAGSEYSVSIVAKLGVGKYSLRGLTKKMSTEAVDISFFATKSGSNLQLIWDEIEGADKYWIKRVDSNGSLTQVKVVENTNTCRLTSVKAGEQQYVLVARVLENGKYYYTNYIYSNKVTI